MLKGQEARLVIVGRCGCEELKAQRGSVVHLAAGVGGGAWAARVGEECGVTREWEGGAETALEAGRRVALLGESLVLYWNWVGHVEFEVTVGIRLKSSRDEGVARVQGN